MTPSRDFRVVLSLAVFLIVSFPQFSAAQGNGASQRLDALEALVRQLQAQLAAETAARMAADTALQNAINAGVTKAELAAEAAARAAADTTLQNNIDAEAAARAAADMALQNNIDAEAAARAAADTALQNDIIGVPAGQTCADGFFVVGFDGEGALICDTTFPVYEATLQFYEGIDLETGMIVEGDGIPEFPAQVDFYFAYNAGRNNPILLFQNQSSGVEILVLDGETFSEVGTATLSGHTFTQDLVDVPFDFNDTIVVRTSEGNVFKIGEPVLNAESNTVSFRYKQLM